MLKVITIIISIATGIIITNYIVYSYNYKLNDQNYNYHYNSNN